MPRILRLIRQIALATIDQCQHGWHHQQHQEPNVVDFKQLKKCRLPPEYQHGQHCQHQEQPNCVDSKRRRLPPELLYEMVQCTLFEQSAKLANHSNNTALTIWAFRHHKRLKAAIDTLLLGVDAVKRVFAESGHAVAGNHIGSATTNLQQYENAQNLRIVSAGSGHMYLLGTEADQSPCTRNFTECHMTVTRQQIAFWHFTEDPISGRKTFTALAFLPIEDALQVHMAEQPPEIQLQLRGTFSLANGWREHAAPGRLWRQILFRPGWGRGECVVLDRFLNAELAASSRKTQPFFHFRENMMPFLHTLASFVRRLSGAGANQHPPAAGHQQPMDAEQPQGPPLPAEQPQPVEIEMQFLGPLLIGGVPVGDQQLEEEEDEFFDASDESDQLHQAQEDGASTSQS